MSNPFEKPTGSKKDDTNSQGINKLKNDGKIFVGTERGPIVDTPEGRSYAEDLDKRVIAMNWDEIKKLEYLSESEDNIELTLKRIKEDADNMDSSLSRNEEELVNLRAAELFLRRAQAKKKVRENKNEKKEKLEGEKLFQYQIENNSHLNAKSLQRGIILFIDFLDKDTGELTLKIFRMNWILCYTKIQTV